MRIISGKKGGIQLGTFKNRKIRPTTDRSRELIFNVLREQIRDSNVLDLYAGTGSLGIEALSRGAARAVFIDNNKEALQTLRNNLLKTDFEEVSEVMCIPARHGLKKLSRSQIKFDLIFADPPYAGNLARETIQLVDQYDLLAPGGWLTVEQSRWDDVSPLSGRYLLKSQKTQGETQLSFYQYA